MACGRTVGVESGHISHASLEFVLGPELVACGLNLSGRGSLPWTKALLHPLSEGIDLFLSLSNSYAVIIDLYM